MNDFKFYLKRNLDNIIFMTKFFLFEELYFLSLTCTKQHISGCVVSFCHLWLKPK